VQINGYSSYISHIASQLAVRFDTADLVHAVANVETDRNVEAKYKRTLRSYIKKFFNKLKVDQKKYLFTL